MEAATHHESLSIGALEIRPREFMALLDGTRLELLHRLKQDPATAEIPILMLTAKAQDADIFKGWQSGCHMYLTKPFNPGELLAFTRRILEEQSQPSSEGRYRL